MTIHQTTPQHFCSGGHRPQPANTASPGWDFVTRCGQGSAHYFSKTVQMKPHLLTPKREELRSQRNQLSLLNMSATVASSGFYEFD